MRKLGEINLHIQRYQQIIQVSVDDKCLCSITAYKKLLSNQVSTLWNDFILVEDLITNLINDADEQNCELLNIVNSFLECYEDIQAVILTQNDLDKLLKIIESVSIIMFVLMPFVSEQNPLCG